MTGWRYALDEPGMAATGDELNGYDSEFGLVAPGETMMKVTGEEVAP